MCGVLRSVLLLGVGCLPVNWGWEVSQMLSAVSCSSPFNIPVFVSHGKRSSNSPPKCPSECLPRITHVPENGFSLHASCRHPILPWWLHAWPLPVLPDLCPARFCCGTGKSWCHDISSRKSYLWVWSPGAKESPIAYPNHDAICLAPLNVNLLGENSQESSLYNCHSWLVSLQMLETENTRLKDT